MQRPVALALLSLLLATPLRAEEASALDQARAAWAAGDMAATWTLALQVLAQHPDDPAALTLLAASAPHLGRAAEGRAAARRAFRLADDAGMKHAAARTAAAAALAEGRLSVAQFWLRRGLIHAPEGAEATRSGQNLATLRRLNPWSVTLDFSVAPSSNLNDGASHAYTMTDWVPEKLSASAQALEGWRATLGLGATLRLRETASSRTRAGLQAFGTFNRFSGSAKAKIAADVAAGGPGLEAADLNYTALEGRIEHRFRPWLDAAPVTLSFAAGRSWYGGAPYASNLRAGASTTLPMGDTAGLEIAASFDQQMPRAGADVAGLGLGFGWLAETSGGDAWRLGLALRQTDSAAVNSIYRSAEVEASFAPARPLGPVTLEARLALGLRDYAAYDMGVFMVEGGRQDESYEAGLDITLPEAALAGFAPTIGLAARKTRSNVGRFNTQELGVTFGFRSLF